VYSVDTTLLKDSQKKMNGSDLDKQQTDRDKAAFLDNQQNEHLINKNGRLDRPISANGNASHTFQETDNRLKAPYDGLSVPLELYWSEYYSNSEHTYEWNNGILEAKPMAMLLQVKMYIWFLNLLQDFLYTNPIAEMTFLETGFEFKLPHKKQVRIPDLAIVLDSNPIPLGERDNSYAGIFDICIESLSTSSRTEIERDTIIKRGEYAQAGVQGRIHLDVIVKQHSIIWDQVVSINPSHRSMASFDLLCYQDFNFGLMIWSVAPIL